MRLNFADRFSLLHFAVGVIAPFWGIDLIYFITGHLIFEYLENTRCGIHLINNYITMWPGGKGSPDSLINIVGDNVFALLGFLVAKLVIAHF